METTLFDIMSICHTNEDLLDQLDVKPREVTILPITSLIVKQEEEDTKPQQEDGVQHFTHPHLIQKTLIEKIHDIIGLLTNSLDHQHHPFKLIYYRNYGISKKSILMFPQTGPYWKPKAVQNNLTTLVRLISLLQIIKTQLHNGKVRTIRDVFYGNKDLFVTQRNVEDNLKTLKDIFKLDSRDLFNIIAAQKGMCFTPINIYIQDPKTNTCLNTIRKNETQLIPYLDSCKLSSLTTDEDLDKIQRIIIFEKEAVFNRVVRWLTFKGIDDTIVITGKGYPDFLTRLFLNTLQNLFTNHPNCKWFIYTDADPHGIDIAEKYVNNDNDQFTCKKLVHQGAFLMQLLSEKLKSPTREIQFLPLQPNEVIFARNLASRISQENCRPNLVVQLQRMLFLQKKAEMNAFDASEFL